VVLHRLAVDDFGFVVMPEARGFFESGPSNLILFFGKNGIAITLARGAGWKVPCLG